MAKFRQHAPALSLFFLSPAIGELLSGASPPLKFFNPLLFVVLCILYGSGALLVRELACRWGKGWPSILTLGASYGLLEEGLMVKSLFDPTWPGLGSYGAVGRSWGVNWIWGFDLTIYHAVFSISIPIVLVGLAFPGRWSQPWLCRRTTCILAGLLGVDVLFGFALMTPYRPPAVQYLLTALLVAGLVGLAAQLPRSVFAPPHTGVSQRRAGWVGLAAFLGTLAYFGTAWGLPASGLSPCLLFEATFAVTAGTVFGIVALTDGGRLASAAHRLAMAAGALSFFILLAPLQEIGRGAAGMTVVGLLAAVMLVGLARHIRRTSGGASVSGAPSPAAPPRG
jgi:hypothetical protein